MSRQDANAAFARTSFLYGGNAAYIEDLYARYEADPNSVDAEWQAFFQSLKDDSGRRRAERAGPVLEAAEPGRIADGELVSALDGNWADGREGDRRQDQGARRRRTASSSPRPMCSRRRAIRSTR